MATVKLSVCPAQIGELLLGTVIGASFTATLTVPIGPVQPATVTLTEYTPAASVEAPAIVGFLYVICKSVRAGPVISCTCNGIGC